MLRFLPMTIAAVWRCWFCQKNHSNPHPLVLLVEDQDGRLAALGLVCPTHSKLDVQALYDARHGEDPDRKTPSSSPSSKEIRP